MSCSLCSGCFCSLYRHGMAALNQHWQGRLKSTSRESSTKVLKPLDIRFISLLTSFNSHLRTSAEFGAGSQNALLETRKGEKYRPVFASLRLQHIIVDLKSSQLLVKDRIIPNGQMAFSDWSLTPSSPSRTVSYKVIILLAWLMPF